MFPYAMIRMNGIELAEGGIVSGIYNEISRKVYDNKVILYDWYIAGVLIVPHVFTVQFNSGSILLNGLVQVTESDEVSIPSAIPVTVVIPLLATSNDTYYPPSGVDGFSPVEVDVSGASVIVVRITTKTTGGSDASVDVYVDEEFVETVSYIDVSAGAYRDYHSIRLMYNVSANNSPDGRAHSGWAVFAMAETVSGGTSYVRNQLVKEWGYTVRESVTALNFNQT